jgi:hypothetical protein
MRFWFTPADPISLGFMRLCTGLIGLYVIASYSFDLLSWVSVVQGWTDEKALQLVRKQWQIYVIDNDWTNRMITVDRGQYTWSIFFHLHDPAAIWTVHIASLICLVLFTVGLWTRITSVLAWATVVGYWQRCQHCMFGMDTMLIIGTTYLMLGPSGSALSLDRWLEQARERKRRGDPKYRLPVEPLVSAGFILRMFQIHFCFIYIASGMSKLLGPAWWSGQAVWGTVANYSFAPLNFAPYRESLRWLTQHRLLWELFMTSSTVFTLFVEISFAYLVWLPSWRWLMVIGSIMLHLGIGVLMGLVGFSLMMITLVFSFIPPEAVRQELESWTGRRSEVAEPAEKVPAAPQPVAAH